MKKSNIIILALLFLVFLIDYSITLFDKYYGDGDGQIETYFLSDYFNQIKIFIFFIGSIFLSLNIKFFLPHLQKFNPLIKKTIIFFVYLFAVFFIFYIPTEYHYRKVAKNKLNIKKQNLLDSKYNFYLNSYPNADNHIYTFKPGEYFKYKNGNTYTEKFKINKHGYRDLNFNNQKKIDIIFYGDSFTFGAKVHQGERFSDILTINNPNLNIANFARNAGYSTPHYLFHYKMNDYNPEKIFIFMYLGNDCFEDLRSTNIISRSKGGIPKNILTEGYLKGDETKYATYIKLLSKQSYFFNQFFSTMYNSKYGSYFFDVDARPNTLNPYELDLGEDEYGCNEALEYVKQLQIYVKQKEEKVELKTFIIPQSFFVYDSLDYAVTKLSTKDQNKAFRNPLLIKNVLRNCELLNIDCIELTPILKSSPLNLYATDGHWNRFGHSIIAEWLQQNYFVDN